MWSGNQRWHWEYSIINFSLQDPSLKRKRHHNTQHCLFRNCPYSFWQSWILFRYWSKKGSSGPKDLFVRYLTIQEFSWFKHNLLSGFQSWLLLWKLWSNRKDRRACPKLGNWMSQWRMFGKLPQPIHRKTWLQACSRIWFQSARSHIDKRWSIQVCLWTKRYLYFDV